MWLGVGGVFCYATLAFASPSPYPSAQAANEAAYKQMEVLARALSDIESRAVTQPSVERLVQAAIRGMLREVDGNSRYVSAKQLEALENSPEGVGEVGLGLSEERGRWVVSHVREGMPAHKAGIHRGDILLSIDGQPTAGLPAAEVRSQLWGPIGSQCTLSFKRESVWLPQHFQLQRVSPGAFALQTSWVDSVWVVRLARFSPGITAEFSKQMAEALQRKPTSILLDLRGNLGGLLQEAVGVAGLFLPPQTPIVHVKSPQAALCRLEKTAPSAPTSTQTPLLVLMDKSSASVTEVLAAALKDNGRAVLWGEKTHGKGSLQEKLLLPDNSAMYLTVAHFIRLTGGKIDGEGVQADCNLNQPKTCKGLENMPAKLAKGLSAEGRDLWLEWALFSLSP